MKKERIGFQGEAEIDPLWSGTNKNRDVSTGPLARPFARSLAPLTRSLAPDCSLRSRPPLRSLVRSLAHFAHSLARGTVNDWMAILSVFFSIFDHSGTSKIIAQRQQLPSEHHQRRDCGYSEKKKKKRKTSPFVGHRAPRSCSSGCKSRNGIMVAFLVSMVISK